MKDQIIRLFEERGGLGAATSAYAPDSSTLNPLDNIQGGLQGQYSLGDQSQSNMRISNKLNREKEGFLPRVDSK